MTPKSDVYGYGVLLLELVTGKPVVQGERSLVEWSRELIGTDCRLHELVDPAVAGAFNLDELQVVTDVIHWCTHRDGAARPSMKQVLQQLLQYDRTASVAGACRDGGDDVSRAELPKGRKKGEQGARRALDSGGEFWDGDEESGGFVAHPV